MRVEWNIWSVERNHQPRILYSVKLSFKSAGEIKIISDQEKLREFVQRSVLSQKLKEIFKEKKHDIDQKTTLKKEKNIREWIHEGKTKSFTFLINWFNR